MSKYSLQTSLVESFMRERDTDRNSKAQFYWKIMISQGILCNSSISRPNLSMSSYSCRLFLVYISPTKYSVERDESFRIPPSLVIEIILTNPSSIIDIIKNEGKKLIVK